MTTGPGQKSSAKKPAKASGRASAPRARRRQETVQPPPDASNITVVGLGGSAGALDSFRAFFEAMPPDSGAAFVVIQHLAPTYESLLPEILARYTSMKVAQARDGVRVEPNCVYVIPPKEYLGIRDGVLYLADRMTPDGIRMPIDFFLRDLAEDRQERAACVLFSGAGSDGTLGVRAIRGAGGLTLAQDPQTAQYGDMPRSAISTKLVDQVLPPAQIPRAITDYLRHPYVLGGGPASAEDAGGKPGGLEDVLATVLAHTGHDFRYYKKSTVVRRIERRMGLRRIMDMARYRDLLRRDADEIDQLHRDLLINVTAFFRDAEAFEELRRLVVAPLVRSRRSGDSVRVWVAGCSSGEEAYSIVILLMEEIAAARKSCSVQVFATDVDEEALESARQGVYPESIVTDVGTERLSTFFARREKGFQVVESVRNCVVFAAHNLITDPPFSKMDLISCRNLLIYLEPETQAKLIPLFNFALNDGGHVFLGKSEGISGHSDLFGVVLKKAGIYRRIVTSKPVVLDTPSAPGRTKAVSTGQSALKTTSQSYADAIRQALLSHFSASVVLVDHKGRILHFHGQTGKYLDMPTGEPSLNLMDVAKEGLSLRLRAALRSALRDHKPVALDPIAVTRKARAPLVRITVTPVAKRGDAQPFLAVIFEDVARPAAAGATGARADRGDAAVRRLEEELSASQQDLRSSVDELRSANEELRVSNEEVVSTNEELQSTNEELETSKEELQSVNEELVTVNSQLLEKIERLDAARSDLANLLESTQIATVFLDAALRIKLFTPAITRVLNLIPSDVGRPIGDLSMGIRDLDLPGDALLVMRGGPVLERDARHPDGSSYLVRVMPYVTQEGRPDGVVVTFDDVSRLRQAEERNRLLATVMADSNDAVIVFDPDGRILAWNRGARGMYGWSEDEALRMNARDLASAEARAAVADLFRRVLAGETVTSFEAKRLTSDGRVVDVWLTATAVVDETKMVAAIATTERDITEKKRDEAALLEAYETMERRVAERTAELARSNKDLEQFAYVASHDLQEPLRMVASYADLLERRYREKLDAAGDDFLDFIVDGARRMQRLISDLLAYSRLGRVEKEMARVDCDAILVQVSRSMAPALLEAEAALTHDPLPVVMGRGGQIGQLLQNLIGNALKFRGTEAPRIHVGAARRGDEWVFSVRDNGIGIETQDTDRIFAIFQRLHSEEEYPGTGIGLAVCKKIVETHGGRIWVESEPGRGSTFYFTIPAGREGGDVAHR